MFTASFSARFLMTARSPPPPVAATLPEDHAAIANQRRRDVQTAEPVRQQQDSVRHTQCRRTMSAAVMSPRQNAINQQHGNASHGDVIRLRCPQARSSAERR